MFVEELAFTWASEIQVEPAGEGDDQTLTTWLRQVAAADPARASDLVSSATDDLAAKAASWAVARIQETFVSRTPDWDQLRWLGGALLRVVERGHGTNFSGGELAIAHSWMVMGLSKHHSDPGTARMRYERAALNYDSHLRPRKAALARLAAATVQRSVRIGDSPDEVREKLAALAQRSGAAAEQLTPALEKYLGTLARIATLRGSADNEQSFDEPDAEAAALLRHAALSDLDDVAVAARLARAADRVGAGSVLVELGKALVEQRRWPQAISVLEECHADRPNDRHVTEHLARAYIDAGHWESAKSMLVPLISDPPRLEDSYALLLLQAESLLRGDPEWTRWRDMLAAVDPDRSLDGMNPPEPGKAPRQQPGPILAIFRDGALQVDPSLFELPQPEQQVHLTAAIVAGDPNGMKLLGDLLEQEQDLGRRVADLLGIRLVSEAEHLAETHLATGESYFQKGQFEEAEQAYRAAVELDPDLPQGWLYIGDTWYRRGVYSIAQAYFEESIAVEPTAQAYRFLGDAIHMAGGSRVRVRHCYEEALRLAPGYGGARVALRELMGPESAENHEADDDQAGPARPLRWQAPVAEHWGFLMRRDGHQRSPSTDVSRTTGHGDRLIATVLSNRPSGSILGSLDNDRDFYRWIGSASPSAIAAGFLEVTSVAFNYRAKDRDVDRWAHVVRKMVALAESLEEDFTPEKGLGGLGRDRLLGDAYYEYGAVLEAQGKPAEARAWWMRALQRLEADQAARAFAGLTGQTEFDRIFDNGDPRSSVLADLARISAALGDGEAAARYWAEAAHVRSASPTTEAWIDQCINAGDHLLSDGDTDSALGGYHEAHEQAEAAAVNQVTPRALAKSYNALGRCHRELGLHRSALNYLDGARKLNELTGHAGRLTMDFRELGRLFRLRPELGDPVEAYELSLLNTSVPVDASDELAWTSANGAGHRITDVNETWESMLELGGVLEDRGDLTRAARLFGLATRVSDVVRSSPVHDAERVVVAGQRAEAAAALTRVQVRRALSGDPDARHAADEAWLASETMRARSFLDALGDDPLGTPVGVEQELIEREIAAVVARKQLIDGSQGDVTFWEDLSRCQLELESIWDEMLTKSPTAAEYVEVRRAQPAPARSVQNLIAADGSPTVIASLVPCGPDELAVIAVRSGERYTSVARRSVDLARLSAFVTGNFGTVGRVRELTTDLYDLWQYETLAVGALLADVTHPEDVVVVCPWGALNYVPFAALAVDDVQFIERNRLAVLPNGSIVRALRAAAGTSAAVRARVFGDPTDDLEGARAEARLIGDLLATEAVLGERSSCAAVSAAFTEAGIVHIAAHARFDADDPLSSGLRLSDGTLTARTLMTTSAPGLSLVTLSACETGISETNPAQELLGLTRALMFAGADSLLVSLWRVPDASTVEIMSDFYAGLENGLWKVDALRTAMLTARERHGPQRFDRWAGFQLMGEWR